MIKDQYLHFLLMIINNTGTVNSLIRSGIDYSQIANLIIVATQEGYIVPDNDGILRLTEIGNAKLDELDKKRHLEILPEEDNRIEKIDKFDVYLPDKKRIKY
jgi:hypothetical protein